MRFYGVHSALCTPFSKSTAVDHAVLGDLVEDQITHGIQGLVPCGSTGEFAALTREERRAVAATVVKATRRRVPITVGVGAVATADAVALARDARDAGADAIMLVGPYYEPLADDDLLRHFEAVTLAAELPTVIYNNPSGTGYSLSTDLIARVAQLAGVVAIKDTTTDARRIYELKVKCPDLQVLNGQDTLQLLGFLSGNTASIWGAGNVAPYQCGLLYRAAVEDRDLVAARAIWDRLYPLNALLESEGYVAAVKAGTALRGIPVGAPRPPIQPLREESAAALGRAWSALEEAYPSTRKV